MSKWRTNGHTAVITGGASGIGLCAAERFARDGMNVVIVDRDAEALAAATTRLEAAADGATVRALACDVGRMEDVETVRDQVIAEFGTVHCLMNNAGRGIFVGAPWENLDELQETLATNLMGIVHGCHAFIPAMLEAGQDGVVINTGSKQGITRPPGNYAYNLSKAGVVAYTESVANAFATLAGCKLSAHLLVPGFVYTSMISRFMPEKPPTAWTPEQTVEFMVPCVDRGDFYVLCPDNEVTREMDEKRIRWNVEDIIENRPALSRWHPDHKDAFEAFMKK